MNPSTYSEYDGYEVLGLSVQGFVRGFKDFIVLATNYLQQEKIGAVDASGMVVVDPKGWYSFPGYLRAFNRIANEVGGKFVFDLGFNVMQNVYWPKEAANLEGMVNLIDFGYHLHHRRNGEVMADPETGRLLEGIGHYIGLKTPDAFIIKCENPYPCQFDEGLIHGALKRLGISAPVVHDDSKPCRRRGGTSCTILIKARQKAG